MSQSVISPQPDDQLAHARTIRRAQLRQLVPLADTTIFELERRRLSEAGEVATAP